ERVEAAADSEVAAELLLDRKRALRMQERGRVVAQVPVYERDVRDDDGGPGLVAELFEDLARPRVAVERGFEFPEIFANVRDVVVNARLQTAIAHGAREIEALLEIGQRRGHVRLPPMQVAEHVPRDREAVVVAKPLVDPDAFLK